MLSGASTVAVENERYSFFRALRLSVVNPGTTFLKLRTSQGALLLSCAVILQAAARVVFMLHGVIGSATHPRIGSAAMIVFARSIESSLWQLMTLTTVWLGVTMLAKQPRQRQTMSVGLVLLAVYFGITEVIQLRRPLSAELDLAIVATGWLLAGALLKRHNAPGGSVFRAIAVASVVLMIESLFRIITLSVTGHDAQELSLGLITRNWIPRASLLGEVSLLQLWWLGSLAACLEHVWRRSFLLTLLVVAVTALAGAAVLGS